MSCVALKVWARSQLMRSVKAVTHRSPFRGRQASPTAALCQRGRRAGPLVFALHMFHTRHGSLYSYHGPAPFPFLGARGVSEQATRGTDTAGGRDKTRPCQARTRSDERVAMVLRMGQPRSTSTAGGRAKTRSCQARVRPDDRGARGVSQQARRGTDTAGGRGKTRVFQARVRSDERGARGVSQQARRGTDTAGGRGKT